MMVLQTSFASLCQALPTSSASPNLSRNCQVQLAQKWVLQAKICFSSILNSGASQIYFWVFFVKKTAQECSVDMDKQPRGGWLGIVSFSSQKSRLNLKRSSLIWGLESRGWAAWVLCSAISGTASCRVLPQSPAEPSAQSQGRLSSKVWPSSKPCSRQDKTPSTTI